jgi:ribosomal protein S18 acetylase RimI-like enzyme
VENVKIRRLRKEDAEAVSRINAVITKSPVESGIKKMVEENAESRGEISFVAEVKGRIVGYMISYLLAGGFGVKKSAWIAMFGVEPKFMGQGIGKGLANEIFKYYREKGIKDVYTAVEWDSTDILSFFKTLGFDRSNFINLKKELD